MDENLDFDTVEIIATLPNGSHVFFYEAYYHGMAGELCSTIVCTMENGDTLPLRDIIPLLDEETQCEINVWKQKIELQNFASAMSYIY